MVIHFRYRHFSSQIRSYMKKFPLMRVFFSMFGIFHATMILYDLSHRSCGSLV
jgi:hypothetical protein